MNTRRSTAKREEGGVAKKRIPIRDQFTMFVLEEEENVEVPLREPQVPLEPQEPQVPSEPQGPQVPPMP